MEQWRGVKSEGNVLANERSEQKKWEKTHRLIKVGW